MRAAMGHQEGTGTTAHQGKMANQATMAHLGGMDRLEPQELLVRQERATERRTESWEDQDRPDVTDITERTARTYMDVPDQLEHVAMRHQL